MINVRRARDRGRTLFDWLDSQHTFSFGEYVDPKQMGFRTLRVLNEDFVKPGKGFGTHPHRNMEILTYVLEGALEHRDSLGTGSVLWAGEFQIMSAGTGIRHSEFNHSKTEAVHFLQIWILPEKEGLPPRHDQKRFSEGEMKGQFRRVVSSNGRDDSLIVKQDAEVFVARLRPEEEVTHQFAPHRHLWLQLTRGKVMANGTSLEPGDGAALSNETKVEIRAAREAEILLFDLG